MKTTEMFQAGILTAQRVVRATVEEVRGDEGLARVTVPGDGVVDRWCDILQRSANMVSLDNGDSVLVWLPEGGTQRPVVLGRLGPPRVAEADAIEEFVKPASPPEELVIEARRSLTLRVGDGSITIREDGRILIKGSDLVSHAQRVNRIKGGSVAIN